MKYLLKAALCCVILIGLSCQKDEGKTLNNEPIPSGSWKTANIKQTFQNKYYGCVITNVVFKQTWGVAFLGQEPKSTISSYDEQVYG